MRVQRYRAQCWKASGPNNRQRVLLATLIIVAESPDDASHQAAESVPAADYVECHPAPLPPAA